MISETTAAPASASRSIDELIREIDALPKDWHLAGSVSMRVLNAIARLTKGRGIHRSVETGSGKTTLLLSHVSRRHSVFAAEGDNHSITAVRDSPLFNSATVEYVEGPTQVTLPRYEFTEPLQFALIDGPHGYPFPDLEYYYLYPHIEPGGLLVVDDVHIPTIRHLFDFLKDDEMFGLVEVVDTTGFFRRTDAALFNPKGDGWWRQNYNRRRFPVESVARKWRRLWPRTKGRAAGAVKRLLGRA